MSVKAIKAGAVDFLTKPIQHQSLLDAVAAAIRKDRERRQKVAQIAELQKRYMLLTPRERQVVAMVASGLMNKQIANELSISEVTVKMHRSSGAARNVVGIIIGIISEKLIIAYYAASSIG
jgi:FixJ family two-component response regulator